MTYLRCIGPLMLSIIVVPAYAEPPKAVEVWGSVGVAHAAGDESFIGTPFAYGAGVSLPLGRRFAVNVAAEQMRPARFNPLTRAFVGPSLVWRWGNERVYGFAGGGVGVQIDRELRFLYDSVPGQQPVVSQARVTDSGPAISGQAGVVFNPVARLIVRAEVVSHWRYILPTTGVRFAVGYRF
jgi:hypothetical protein